MHTFVEIVYLIRYVIASSKPYELSSQAALSAYKRRRYQGHSKNCYTRQLIYIATCRAIVMTVPLQQKLHLTLCSVTCPEMNLSVNVFVASNIIQSKSDLCSCGNQKHLRDIHVFRGTFLTLGNDS